MSEINPWDSTIWDPIDPEHAIEDPMHGPSAVHAMRQIPAMPIGDGTYYQPGAFYATGTGYVDSKDRPVFRPSSAGLAGMVDIADLYEWNTTSQKGEEALVALEATRQLDRLAETGQANCYRPTDVCPGGKKLIDCETGSSAYVTGEEWAANHSEDKTTDGKLSVVLAWASGKCVECALSCQVAVTTKDGKPQETRVSYFQATESKYLLTLDLLPTTSLPDFQSAQLEEFISQNNRETETHTSPHQF